MSKDIQEENFHRERGISILREIQNLPGQGHLVTSTKDKSWEVTFHMNLWENGIRAKSNYYRTYRIIIKNKKPTKLVPKQLLLTQTVLTEIHWMCLWCDGSVAHTPGNPVLLWLAQPCSHWSQSEDPVTSPTAERPWISAQLGDYRIPTALQCTMWGFTNLHSSDFSAALARAVCWASLLSEVWMWSSCYRYPGRSDSFWWDFLFLP